MTPWTADITGVLRKNVRSSFFGMAPAISTWNPMEQKRTVKMKKIPPMV